MTQFAGSAPWAESSPLFAHRARPTPLKCINEYLVLALRKETVVQAVVCSIVWAFRRLKKSRSREMSARDHVPKFSFSPNLLFLLPCPCMVTVTEKKPSCMYENTCYRWGETYDAIGCCCRPGEDSLINKYVIYHLL